MIYTLLHMTIMQEKLTKNNRGKQAAIQKQNLESNKRKLKHVKKKINVEI